MKRKITAYILTALMLFVTLTVSASSYADTDGHWAEETIDRWSEKNIITGSDGKFRPDESITRGEAAVIIDRIKGYDGKAENTFSDLENLFYTDSLLKLVNKGIMQGANNEIRPDDAVTRQETSVMLCRAYEIEPLKNPISYSDADEIADWAYGYISALTENKCLMGAENKFNPQNNVTRAEFIIIVDRIDKLKAQTVMETNTPTEKPTESPTETPKQAVTAMPQISPTVSPEPTVTAEPQIYNDEEPEDERGKCTFSISCDTFMNYEEADADILSSQPEGGFIFPPQEIYFETGDTVYSLLERICEDNGIDMISSYTGEYNSVYIEGINGLSEFDAGALSGWMYSVNGECPNFSSSLYPLSNGDEVEWRYSCNLGEDIGGGVQ